MRGVFSQCKLLEIRKGEENAHNGGPGMEPTWGEEDAHERRYPRTRCESWRKVRRLSLWGGMAWEEVSEPRPSGKGCHRGARFSL